MLAKVWDVFMEYKDVAARRWVAVFVACCGVMSMGDLGKIGEPQHLLVATLTGIMATLIIIGSLVISKDALKDKGKKEAGLVFVSTGIADFVVHPSNFALEAVVTGAVAVGVAWCISKLMSKVCQCD